MRTGQTEYAEVTIRVLKFARLEVFAYPEPSYAGMSQINRLSALACTSPKQWQKAKLTTRMVLTGDGGSKDISALGSTSYSVSSDVIAIAGRVLTHADGGAAEADVEVNVRANFQGKLSDELTMTLSTDEVRFVSFSNLNIKAMGSGAHVNLNDGLTLSGPAGVTARVMFGGTTSDGRKYTSLMKTSGVPAFDSFVSFHVASVHGASDGTSPISVDDTTLGVVTLNRNSMAEERLTVRYCPESGGTAEPVELSGSSKIMYGNLQPTTGGDGDLGSKTRMPLACAGNGKMSVAARVNTDSKTLGSFTVGVHYDSEFLEFASVKHTISKNQGTVTMEYVDLGTDDPADSTIRELLVAATVTGSTVKGSGANPARVDSPYG